MTPTIAIHTIAAMLAVPLGLMIFGSRKGTPTHRALGRAWVALMLVTALTALFIREINDGAFSVIHLLIPFTLAFLVRAIYCIRKFRLTRNPYYQKAHMRSMIGVYIGLVSAGVFAFWPGRLLARLLFG